MAPPRRPRQSRLPLGTENLPPLPGEGAKSVRNKQVSIRLSEDELVQLRAMRPDLTPAGIVSLLVSGMLDGSLTRPTWMAPADPDTTD